MSATSAAGVVTLEREFLPERLSELAHVLDVVSAAFGDKAWPALAIGGAISQISDAAFGDDEKGDACLAEALRRAGARTERWREHVELYGHSNGEHLRGTR